MDPPANLSYFTLSTPAPGETNRSSFDAADPRPNLPPALCLRGACPDLAGLPGGGHVRLEPAGAGDHSPRAHIPPRSAQLDGIYGHLGRAGSRSGHAAEPGARAVRAPLAAGPAAVPAVDRVRCALLHGQHLERDGHRAGPLLVHHPSPGIHAARPQARLQRHDRAHLGALRRHLLGPADLRLGRDLLGGQRGVPGEPRALLHVFSTAGAFCLPLGVVLFVYWKIYKAAKLRVGPRKTNSVSPISETVQVKGAAQRPEMVLATRRATVPFQADGDAWGEQKEQRAALTVGILIGVFALCWIPFFTAELLSPLRTCDSPATWKSVFLWLGYSNSFLNPPSTWPSTRTTTAPSRTSSRGTAEREAGQARGTRPSAHPHPATTCQRQGFEVPRVAPRANWLTAALPAGSESAWAVPGTSFYPIYLLVLTRHCTATDLAHQVPFPL